MKKISILVGVGLSILFSGCGSSNYITPNFNKQTKELTIDSMKFNDVKLLKDKKMNHSRRSYVSRMAGTYGIYGNTIEYEINDKKLLYKNIKAGTNTILTKSFLDIVDKKSKNNYIYCDYSQYGDVNFFECTESEYLDLNEKKSFKSNLSKKTYIVEELYGNKTAYFEISKLYINNNKIFHDLKKIFKDKAKKNNLSIKETTIGDLKKVRSIKFTNDYIKNNTYKGELNFMKSTNLGKCNSKSGQIDAIFDRSHNQVHFYIDHEFKKKKHTDNMVGIVDIKSDNLFSNRVFLGKYKGSLGEARYLNAYVSGKINDNTKKLTGEVKVSHCMYSFNLNLK